MKAIRPPASSFGVGTGVCGCVSAGVATDAGGTMTATDGEGDTTAVRRMSPEPVARAPPTTRTAATASSVNRRRPANGRTGAGVVAGIAAEALAQIGRRGLGRADLGGVPGPQALFQVSIGHRTVPLVSAASIASCSRFSA